jgi:hypothetical protein
MPKAMSYGRMQQREAQLKEEIARLVEQAEAQDATEDQEYGVDSDGYSVAEELVLRAARSSRNGNHEGRARRSCSTRWRWPTAGTCPGWRA